MTSLATKSIDCTEPLFSAVTWVRRPEYALYITRPGFPPKRKLRRFKKVRMPKNIWPLDILRIVGCDAIPCEPGIYFLWRGPQLLYIGQTINLNHRIYQHASNRDGYTVCRKRIPFTHYTFLFCSAEDRLEIESQYIRTYFPPYNDKV